MLLIKPAEIDKHALGKIFFSASLILYMHQNYSAFSFEPGLHQDVYPVFIAPCDIRKHFLLQELDSLNRSGSFRFSG
jgi:hypothetical protein